GRGWHQDKWSDTPELVEGQPVHTALSASAPNHPVMLIHASGHSVLANAKAMEVAGVDAATTIGEEGEIYHFPNGQPTGLFAEAAQSLIRQHIPKPTEAEEEAALKAAVAQCLREGVTFFQDAGSGQQEIDRFMAFLANEELKIRLSVMLHGGDTALLDHWYERGPLIGDQLSVRAIKLYADGALGSRGAWLLESYTDRPGHFGNPVMPIEYIGQVANEGLEHGFQVCTHAIGDRANREVLNHYEAAFAAHPDLIRDHRFRIEHAQHLHPDDIPRFAKLGVIASMQGVHLSSDRPWAIDRLGRLRIQQGAYMWKALLTSGARVINGTDVPVEPLNPIANYFSLVTRKTLAGEPEGGYEPNQKLTRMEALKAYSSEGAYGGFKEGRTGSLSAGKWADFVVLSQDIIEVPENEILATTVLMTWINGKPLFVDPSWKQ
ncbi:MAG: amidohydrolase, partial [Bacteroidia bacterium]|nr:amidohydrolase [Bacteroidia bacterium]